MNNIIIFSYILLCNVPQNKEKTESASKNEKKSKKCKFVVDFRNSIWYITSAQRKRVQNMSKRNIKKRQKTKKIKKM